MVVRADLEALVLPGVPVDVPKTAIRRVEDLGLRYEPEGEIDCEDGAAAADDRRNAGGRGTAGDDCDGQA